jgi:hypothetical protein
MPLSASSKAKDKPTLPPPIITTVWGVRIFMLVLFFKGRLKRTLSEFFTSLAQILTRFVAAIG